MEKKKIFFSTIMFLSLIFTSINVNARLFQQVSDFTSSFFRSMPQAYQIKIMLAFIVFFILLAVININFNNKPKSKFSFALAALIFSSLLTVGLPNELALKLAELLGTMMWWIFASLPVLFIILFFWMERSLKVSLGNDSKAEHFLEVIFSLLTVILLNFAIGFFYSSTSSLNSDNSSIITFYADILEILMYVYIIKLALGIFNMFGHVSTYGVSKMGSGIADVSKNVASNINNTRRELGLKKLEKETLKNMMDLDLIEGKDISVLKDILSKLETLIKYFSNPRVWDKVDAGALNVLSRKLRALEQEGISRATKLVKDFQTEYENATRLMSEVISFSKLEKFSDDETRALFRSRFRKLSSGKLSALSKKLNDLHRKVKKDLKKLAELDENIKEKIKEAEEMSVSIEKVLKQAASEINLVLGTLHNLNEEEKEQAARKLQSLINPVSSLNEIVLKIERIRDEIERELKEMEKIFRNEEIQLLREVKVEKNVDSFLNHIGEHVDVKF